MITTKEEYEFYLADNLKEVISLIVIAHDHFPPPPINGDYSRFIECISNAWTQGLDIDLSLQSLPGWEPLETLVKYSYLFTEEE